MIGYINIMAMKLIIFDLDGTLVDSSTDISHAINYALEGTNVPPVTVQETITMIGEGITMLFEKIIQKIRENFIHDRTRPHPAAC